jgi:hypothetical protein
MLELVNIAHKLCEHFYRDYVMLRGVYLLGHIFWYFLISPYIIQIFLFLNNIVLLFVKIVYVNAQMEKEMYLQTRVLFMLSLVFTILYSYLPHL